MGVLRVYRRGLGIVWRHPLVVLPFVGATIGHWIAIASVRYAALLSAWVTAEIAGVSTRNFLQDWVSGEQSFFGVLPPVAVDALWATAVIGIGLLIPLFGMVAAFRTHAAHVSVRDETDPLATALERGRSDLRAFVLLAVVKYAIVFLPLALLAYLDVELETILAALVFVTFPLGASLTLFAPQAIAVDRLGARGAVRRNLEVLFRRPHHFLLHGLFMTAAIGIVLFWLAEWNTPSTTIAPTVAGLALFTLLGVASLPKSALYDPGALGEETPPRAALAGVREWGRAVPREFVAFLRNNLVAVGVTATVSASGIVAGWWLTPAWMRNPFGSISRSPVEWAVFYLTNNWPLAVGRAFSGVGFGLPSAFWGFLSGMRIGVFVERTGFDGIVWLLPHGIVEIPSFVLAEAFGLAIGIGFFRFLRGDVSPDRLATLIRRGLSLLLVLFFALALAAVIEAFVSPRFFELV